jgi:hypothetical protein
VVCDNRGSYVKNKPIIIVKKDKFFILKKELSSLTEDDPQTSWFKTVKIMFHTDLSREYREGGCEAENKIGNNSSAFIPFPYPKGRTHINRRYLKRVALSFQGVFKKFKNQTRL